MKHRWVIRLVVITLFGGVLWVATMRIAYTDRGYICENTGSRMGYREWFFGIKTNEWYYESELERFMEARHPAELQHRWTSYRGTGSSLIPVMKSYGHGRPGLIVTPTRERFDEYVRETLIYSRWSSSRKSERFRHEASARIFRIRVCSEAQDDPPRKISR